MPIGGEGLEDRIRLSRNDRFFAQSGRSRNERLEKRFADMNCGLFGSTHDVVAELAWIAEIGDLPAI